MGVSWRRWQKWNPNPAVSRWWSPLDIAAKRNWGNDNPPNMPANYHNGACDFSFVDGHAVTHKWRHASTLKKSLLSGGPWDSRADFQWAQ